MGLQSSAIQKKVPIPLLEGSVLPCERLNECLAERNDRCNSGKLPIDDALNNVGNYRFIARM